MSHGPPSPEATIKIPTAKSCKVCRGPILPGEAYVPGSGRDLPVHARHPPVPSRPSDWPGAKAVAAQPGNVRQVPGMAGKRRDG